MSATLLGRSPGAGGAGPGVGPGQGLQCRMLQGRWWRRGHLSVGWHGDITTPGRR